MIATIPMRFRLAGVIATALTLAACGPQGNADQSLVAANTTAPLPPLPDALPLASGTATPIAAAPAVSALPRARPLAWGRARGSGEDYAWIDRAYDMTDAIGDAPPDYAFDYDGVSPWAWQTDDNYVTYAEPIDDGYRYYYYEPGADAPFLVRDPQYSYGYSGGRVVAVYDGGGRALAYDQARREADAAARYYARAEALRQAARANNRRAVIAANWAARRDSVARARIELARAQSQQPEWRDYRNRDATQERHWQDEQQRRAVAAQRFASWERDGLRGPPPAVNRAVVQQQAQARIDAQRQAEAAARQQQALALQQRAQIVAGRQAQAEQLAQQRQQMIAAQRQQAVQQRDDVARRQQLEATQRQQAIVRRQQVAARQQQDQVRAAQVQREAAIRQRNQVAAQQQAQRAAVADRRQQTLEAQAAAGRQRQAQVAQRQEAARAAQASRAEAARAHAAEASAARARQEAVGRQRAQQVRAQQADVAQQRAVQVRAQQQAVTQARAQQAAARAEQAQAARAQQQAAAQARTQQVQAAASARQAQAAQARAAQAAAHPAGPPAGGHGRHEGRRPDQ